MTLGGWVGFLAVRARPQNQQLNLTGRYFKQEMAWNLVLVWSLFTQRLFWLILWQNAGGREGLFEYASRATRGFSKLHTRSLNW
jgi:hypothetical protein